MGRIDAHAKLGTETLASAGVEMILNMSDSLIMPVNDACIDAGILIAHRATKWRRYSWPMPMGRWLRTCAASAETYPLS